MMGLLQIKLNVRVVCVAFFGRLTANPSASVLIESLNPSFPIVATPFLVCF